MITRDRAPFSNVARGARAGHKGPAVESVVLDEHGSLGPDRPRLAEWIERLDALPRAP